MKNILFILISAVVLAGCNNDPRMKMAQEGPYGAPFTIESPVTVEQVVTALDTANNIQVQVTGTVSQYCKGEGCWLTLKNSDGEDLYVEVKDKAYVLPYNIENKTATAMGVAQKDTVDGKVEVKIVAEGIMIEKK